MTGVFVQYGPGGPRGVVGWIEDGSGCHVWVGALNGGGYGRVWTKGRYRPAHVIRYEREIGPIPDGMDLDHFRCDNKACCNPAHVRPVTVRENVLRGNSMAARHAAKTHCPQRHPLAGDNLVASFLVLGQRSCRVCRNVRQGTPERRAAQRIARNTPEYRAKDAAAHRARKRAKLALAA